MNALATLRHLTLLFVFALAAGSASASEGAKKTRKGDNPGSSAGAGPAVTRTVKAQRKMVAPFVDPTLPLTELVERARTERTH